MTRSTEQPHPVQIGHWSDPDGNTGCTVILFESLTPAVVDIRGGSPGTRETDLLASGRTVRAVDAIVLTGGSAFGLAAADGVMRYLRELDRGYPTRAGGVPIVPAAVIFDLKESSSAVPDADSGYLAARAAEPLPRAFAGRTGGGTGATMQKLWGDGHVMPGGLGIATVNTPLGLVTAVVIVNAAGAPAGRAGAVLPQGDGQVDRLKLLGSSEMPGARESTVIGAIIVGGTADHAVLERCAIAAHDGLARSIVPAHTVFDGDTVFAVGHRPGTPERGALLALPTAAEIAVEQAVEAVARL